MKLLYNPKEMKAMNCIVFASTNGSNLEKLAKDDIENHYKIKGVFSDRYCEAVETAKEMNLPIIYKTLDNFCGFTWEQAKEANPVIIGKYLKLGEEYDRIITNKIEKFSEKKNFNIDLILLAGYKRDISPEFAKTFKDKIIEVQPSKLSVRGDDGKRLYKGDNAVMKAIACGEKQTYSSIYLVNEEPYEGEILVRSKPYPLNFERNKDIEIIVDNLMVKEIHEMRENKKLTSDSLDLYLYQFKEDFPNEFDKIENFCNIHQDDQKRYCDWPAFTFTTKRIAEGRVAISEEKDDFDLRDVYIDDKKIPFSGYELK